MDPIQTFLSFLEQRHGQFTVAAVHGPLEVVSAFFSRDNSPLPTATPIPEGRSPYSIRPAIVLTQAVNSPWTLIIYSDDRCEARVPLHLEALTRELSVQALLHSFDDTYSGESAYLFDRGQKIHKYETKSSRECNEGRGKSVEGNRDLTEADAAASDESGVTIEIVESCADAYAELDIVPIAARVDEEGHFRVAERDIRRLRSAAAYDLKSFKWRGLVNVDANWAEQIDLDTLEFSHVTAGFCRENRLLLTKSRTTIDGRNIVTTRYDLATANGLTPLDHLTATQLLTDSALKFMRTTGCMPVRVEVKKCYKNGNIDLAFQPTKFDRFTFRITGELLGEEPSPFIDSLAPTRRRISFGSIEPAKSSRSTCRTCSKPIEKGELRIGEYHERYFEYPPNSWNHARCVTLANWQQLHQIETLTASQREELEKLFGGTPPRSVD